MRATVLATALLVAPAAAAGQDAQLNLFLFEKSYAARGTPKVEGKPAYYDASVAEPDLIAEAQFVAHAVLHRGLGEQELRDGTGGWGFNWLLTPQFRLRGLDTISGPVKSISFMPKLTIQLLRSTGGGPPETTAGFRKVYGANLVIGHHSNGGSTCEFVDEDPAQACASRLDPLPQPAEREYWVNGGNFSTNYLELGVSLRLGVLEDPGIQHWDRVLDVSLSGQQHHGVGLPLPGGARPGFRELYGTSRLRLDVGAHKVLPGDVLALRGWLRVDALLNATERFSGSRNHTIESELIVQPVKGLSTSRWTRFLPAFVAAGVRYVHGMDYYNTQFVRDICALEFVVVVDPWSPRARGGT